MIGFLRGEIASISESQVFIDVGGIGYRVSVPTTVAAAVRVGEQDVKIHTSTVVTDNAISLYGFLTAGERDIFETLTTVSGIGPKVAVKLLSLPREQLVEAIQAGDIAVLTRVQGVGKKIAERIVLELRDKVTKSFGSSSPVSQAVLSASGEVGLAMNALQSLGFSASEVRSMMKQFSDDELKTLSAQQIITLCLKKRT